METSTERFEQNFTNEELQTLRMGMYEIIDKTPLGKIALRLWDEIRDAQDSKKKVK